MKTNILKKCACLLLIGGLFAPVQQIKANLGAGIAAIFILAAMAADGRQAQSLSENEAHDIILNFFNSEKRETITSRQLSHALKKFNMSYFETAFFVLNHKPYKAYQAIQRNLNRLPEDLQELFKAISEEEFCENIKQLKPKTPAPAIKAEEATTTTKTKEEIEKEIRQRSLFCTLKKEHYPTQELFETISA